MESVRCACFAKLRLEGSNPGESSLNETGADTIPTRVSHRVEHYELMYSDERETGRLGRGDDGVTLKPYIDLRCHVTLKVISEYLLVTIGSASVFARSACSGRCFVTRCSPRSLHLGRSARGSLLRDGVCGGGTLETHQAIRPA